MINLDSSIPLDFGKFWSWWTSELAFLVPAPVKNLIRRKKNFLLVEKNGDQIQLIRVADGVQRVMGAFGVDEVGDPEIRLISELQEADDSETVLRLSPQHGLRKTITLPAAVQENLKKVVEFEMDRQTPFQADQVYYDVKVIERLPESKQVRVEMILILRSKLDQILMEISRLGLRPTIVDLAQLDGELGVYEPFCNLLPETLRTTKRDLPRLLNISLALFMLLLFIVLLIIPIWTKKTHLATLELELSKVGKVAREVRALRKDLDDRLKESDFLIEKKRDAPVLVETLDELTKLVPDQTWLTNLQFKTGRLQIQGQSPGASQLIEVIESSPQFKDTRFVSPITQDRKTKLERFQIATQAVNRRQNERPTDS